jgi:hypothetical protein
MGVVHTAAVPGPVNEAAGPSVMAVLFRSIGTPPKPSAHGLSKVQPVVPSSKLRIGQQVGGLIAAGHNVNLLYVVLKRAKFIEAIDRREGPGVVNRVTRPAAECELGCDFEILPPTRRS